MNKYLKRNLKDLHYNHKITHKVASLIIFSILMLLVVVGFSQVKATRDLYEPVPNANHNICYKVGDNFNDPNTHVSCISYKSVCQTISGALVECDTGILIQ